MSDSNDTFDVVFTTPFRGSNGDVLLDETIIEPGDMRTPLAWTNLVTPPSTLIDLYPYPQTLNFDEMSPVSSSSSSSSHSLVIPPLLPAQMAMVPAKTPIFTGKPEENVAAWVAVPW